jgi:hypothetical protein
MRNRRELGRCDCTRFKPVKTEDVAIQLLDTMSVHSDTGKFD